jgi:uncharacterized integral membrane protein (TIGR00698 family)
MGEIGPAEKFPGAMAGGRSALNQTVKIESPARTRFAKVSELAPGLAIAGAVAFAASLMTAWETALARVWFGRPIAVAAPVIALLIGVALHGIAARPSVMPGLTFAIKRVLRWAIAPLGPNIALSDIIGLGVGTVAMVIVAMAATLISGLFFARLFGKGDPYGALAGAACAVCGASAALATSTVLPPGEHRESDTAFVVITTNLLATLAILAYPPLCAALGFDDRATGIFLGASIHDVAQVVGAGYSVSNEAGNIALVVKLFRVLMLLPVVLSVGWFFAGQGGDAARAKVLVPVFALMFLVFVLVNSSVILPAILKSALIAASGWGLLLALAALGLNTSIASILRVGPKHLGVVLCTTAVVFCVPLAWLVLSR